MARVGRTGYVLVVALALGQTVFAQAALEITLKQGTPREAQTRDRHQKLMAISEERVWTTSGC